MRSWHKHALAPGLLLAVLVLGACGGPAGPAIEARDVWARPAIAGGTAGVFLRLVNGGGEADRLLGGSTDVADVVEIHETVMEGDVMRMQMLSGGLEIPAGGEVVLQPGSYHLMLIGLQRDLAVGDELELALAFEQSGTLTVEAQVRQP
jgi:copper(I)-binding protein